MVLSTARVTDTATPPRSSRPLSSWPSAAPTAALAQPSGATKKPSGDTSFSSSFEADEKQPDWRNTVEEGVDGKKRASGVDGGFSAGIPGNVTDQVTDLRASDENAAGGEVKENLTDVEPGTKWLAFKPTGWVEFDLAEPVKVVTYALTSANDHDERDPKDWTLKGSTDGKTWTDLDTRTGQTFSERLQTKSYDFTTDTAYQHFRLEITKNNGASDALQLADVQFSNGDTSTPAPDDMRTQADRRPLGLPHRQAGRRVHREEGAALRGYAQAGRPRLLVQQGLRRQHRGHQGHPAVLPGLSRRWARRTSTTPRRTWRWTWPSPTAPT